MSEDAQLVGDDDYLIPLKVAAIFPSPVDPTNPLLRELLSKDYPDLFVDGDSLRVPQRSLMWATLAGDPFWADHVIRPAEPWSLEGFGTPANWESAYDDVQGMMGWLEIVEDFHGGWFPALRRIAAMQEMVGAVYRAMNPAALAWHPSKSLMREPGQAWPIGIISVRRMEDGEAVLIDTLGAHAFDLPDFQCFFSGLSEDVVIEEVHTRVLRAIEESEIIDDGDPVISLRDPSLWFTARFGPAAQSPERDVCMLIPPESQARGPQPPPVEEG